MGRKKAKKVTNPTMTFSSRGLFHIAYRTFYLNSPLSMKQKKDKETREFIDSCVSWYEYKLPVVTQEFARYVARETYQYWKMRGWRKKKINKKTVWQIGETNDKM